MKILAVLPTYRPSSYKGKVGGGEISNKILLEGLVKRGHDVTVCTLDAGPEKITNINGVKIKCRVFYKKNKKLSKLKSIIKYRSLVESEVISQKPHVILTGTYGIRPATIVSNLFGIPVGAFVRSYETFEGSNRLRCFFHSCIKKIVYGSVGPDALKKLNFVLPNSVYISNLCEKHMPYVPYEIIYPALDVFHVSEVKKNKNPRKVFMVNASVHKGFKVFVYLAEKFPDLEFHILGDDLSDSCNIKFHGWVDVCEKLQKDADVLLVPSICREAFGRVSLEGLISGIPTIVSDIGGLPETVDFEKELLVEPGNKIMWYQALLKIIKKPEASYEATKRAQRSVVKYSANAQLNKLECYLLLQVNGLNE